MGPSIPMNPYDFANPVSDEDLFVGRSEEMQEIEYYLENAKASNHPINIALLGRRASGKTSFLNIIENKSMALGFIPVRIDLDEGDSESPLILFSKIFDCILYEVVKRDHFGGKTGKTWQAYLDLSTTYRVPDDLLFCPFLFPVQYAKAMGAGNSNAVVSDNSFRHDLELIIETTQSHFLLLFDECNVLTKNRILIQKLRNIFSRTKGYMLIFTGTEDLFPVMNEVFSPIIRQFKKIDVRNFHNIQDTINCIESPLSKVGLDLDVVFGEKGNIVLAMEINELTSGRPYEIQLICHILYRRFQQGETNHMELSLPALEQVRRELEASQIMSERKILRAITNLDKGQLIALDMLCESIDNISVKDAMFRVNVFRVKEKQIGAKLPDYVTEFEALGIITIVDGEINFEGDEFDAMYAKYHARDQDIRLDIKNVPGEIINGLLLLRDLKSEKLSRAGFRPFYRYDLKIEENIHKLLAKIVGPIIEIDDQFISTVYRLGFGLREGKSKEILCVRVDALGIKWQYCFAIEGFKIESTTRKLEKIAGRAKRNGGDVQFGFIKLTFDGIQNIFEKIVNGKNKRLKNIIVNYHNREMVRCYLKKGSKDAKMHAEQSVRLDGNQSDNNLGYYFLSEKKYETAEKIFLRMIRSNQQQNKKEKDHKDHKDQSIDRINIKLARYNYGITLVMLGRNEEGGKQIEDVIRSVEGGDMYDKDVNCLMVLENMGGEYKIVERSNPDLISTAKESFKVLTGD